MPPTLKEICFSQSRGFDPQSGFCVIRQQTRAGEFETIYFVPGQTGSTTAPIVATDPKGFVWPSATPPNPEPTFYPWTIVPQGGGGIGTMEPQSFLDGAMKFLQTPGPLGIPYWALGAGIVVAVIVLSSTGSTGKKSAAWI